MAARSEPSAASAEAADRLRGIAFLCLGVLLFSVLDTAAKYAGRFVPVLEVAWFRYAVHLAVALIVMRPWRNLAAFVTRRPMMQAFRGLLLLVSTILNFLAIQHLQLAETAAITFAQPLIVTALAGPVLGEHVGPRRWAAVIVGFVGVLIVIQPTPASFQPAALFSLAATFCYAGYALTTRVLTATDSSTGMNFYSALIAAVALTPALPPLYEAPPTLLVFAALMVTGVAGALGHWCLIIAYRYAPATVVTPFNYTQLIWMVTFGYLAFGDVPGPATVAGAAVIVASGLYIIYRERVRGGA